MQGACVQDLIEDLQTAMAMQEGNSRHQALKPKYETLETRASTEA
jgi:hypothetical protein